MQGGTVRIAAAGFLAVLILSALGPSTAAAVEAAEDQPPSAAPVEPETPPSPPEPPQTQPPEPPKSAPPEAATPHPTLKPKPATTPKPRGTPKAAPTPKPKPKPKPKPTPVKQSAGHVPGGQTPGDPKPVRSDEPPTAPVLSEPPAPPLDAPVDRPGGGAGSSPTDEAPGLGPPSRVHLVVAGATVSGIAAVAGWLVLGGRRRERPHERPRVRIPQPPATTVTLADGMELDLEVVVNRPDGPPPPRYSGRGPAAATTLWTDDDERPRWLRRFDEQGPARPRAPRSSIGLEDRDED